MRVSLNEIYMLSKKGFCALNLPIGEADRIAHSVVCVEIAVGQGLRHFAQALNHIQIAPPDIQITHNTNSNLAVDMCGGTILLHLPTLMYTVRQKIHHTDCVTLQIYNAYNRWLAYGELQKIAELGYCVRATWGERCTGQNIQYIRNHTALYPDIYITTPDKMTDCLYICIQKRPFDMPITENNITHIPACHIAHKYTTCVQRGVTVNLTDWNILNNIAKMGLVKNSTQSAQGAGGI